MKQRVFAAVALAAAGLVAVQARSQTAQAPAAAPKADWAVFERIASVLQHPRCMNCHTVTQFPRQKDTGTPHVQLIVRGKEARVPTPSRARRAITSTTHSMGRCPAPTDGTSPR